MKSTQKKILIVSSEILKDKYSASLTTYKFIQEASKLYCVDVLTEPMSIFNFEHRIQHLFYTNYQGHKGYLHLKVINRLYKLLFKHNVYRRLRYRAFVTTLKKMDLQQYQTIIAFGGGDFFEPLEALATVTTPKTCKKIGYVHDPYPVDVYPPPYQEQSTPKTLQQRKNLSSIFNRLTYLAFPSLILGEWMQTFYKFDPSKIIVVPHALPTEVAVAHETQVHDFLEKHQLTANEFYLHAGTLLYHRRVEFIIEAFKQYKQSLKEPNNLKLVFIGNCQYPINQIDADVIIINNRLPLKLINALSIQSKGLLIIEHIGTISPFLPGKFPEYLYFNKPILHFGPENSEINRIVQLYFNNNITKQSFSAPLNAVDKIKRVFEKGGVLLSTNENLMQYFRFQTIKNQL